MKRCCLFVLIAGAGVSASSQASVFFTFEDPGAGAEISYTKDDATADPGVVTYIGAPVELVVDGSENALPITTFNSNLTMNLLVGAATTVGGQFIAPILSGTFSFSEVGSGDVIFSATVGAEAGAVITLGTTGSMIAQGDGSPLGLVFQSGAALDALLNGLQIGPIFNASFTLTNISPQAALNNDGFLQSFTASSAFTADAQVIPSPGAMALIGLSALSFFSKRSRPVTSAAASSRAAASS